MGEVTITAWAKVNLYLRILGRREDGYHELESVMQKVSLADLVTLRHGRAGIRLSCPGSDLPEDDSNLAYRAAQLFFARTGLAAKVELVLAKRIPVAAGLGGGSSDAAAVLNGLNLLHGAPLTGEELLALGATLGSDVPFFVAGTSAAWATGRGDRLQPLASLRACWLLLVNPGFPVATKWVYDTFALTSAGNPYMLGRTSAPAWEKLAAEGWGALDFSNDLEVVTASCYPAITQIRDGLRTVGAEASLMSGSGPTVFGLFRTEAGAERGWEYFKKRYQDVFLTRPC